MANTQENARPDPSLRPQDMSREMPVNDDVRNPKTLDRDHGAEVSLARQGMWIATPRERES
jgi:hypothetical protein